MVNEETFKQIYAQFFPHGGESGLKKDPAPPPLWWTAFLSPPLCSFTLLSASASALGRQSKSPPLITRWGLC